MDGTTNATGVTPHGVRAGDPAALQGLVERRGPAVVAFCTQVCGPEHAARAAAEAFARFRAAVRDTPDLSEIDPEGLLRGATRHSAAAMARVPLGPPPTGRLRSRGTQTCEHVPVMLAARANGALGDADLERLGRHLERCERCEALGDIFRRAELAYADPSADSLPAGTYALLLEALESVSPEGLGYAPPPETPGALPTQITGTLPTLPDLDDEVLVPVEPAPAAAGAGAEHGDAERYEDDEDDDLGTYEFEPVRPEVVPPASLVGTDGGRRRRSGPVRVLRVLLPAAVIVAAAIGVLLASGVLNGPDGTPPITHPIASGIQAPVTTPLPVTVSAADRASGASTGTGATAAPSATAAAGTTAPVAATTPTG